MRTLARIFCVMAALHSFVWCAEDSLPTTNLILDLDADKGLEVKDETVVLGWWNQIDGHVSEFKATRDNGRPALKKEVVGINGHNALVFKRQELVNQDEDAFDHLVTGSGYTWIAVMAVYHQNSQLKDVNSFFGNLKNGGHYEGLWGGLNDDNSVWIGSRNSTTFGRWDENNPKVQGPVLEEGPYYVIVGRMGSGTGEALVELFLNEPTPVASKPFPVNPKANASKMAIGQERDAADHPGKESFDGEIARFLIWERPLTDIELTEAFAALKEEYGIK